MSTIKANNLQVGQSLTSTNNFTWYQPASPDGTVRLGNGNSGSVTDVMTATSAGNVGIGITTPTLPLTIQSPASGGGGILVIGQTNNERILVKSASNSGGVGTSVVTLLTARGTQASPSAVQAGDQLGYYQFGGYDSVDYLRSAWIQGVAAENYSPTNRGSIMVFSTTPTGSTTITERMRIDAAGNLGLGVTPSAWVSPYKAIQLGSYSSFADDGVGYSFISNNSYSASGSWKYLNTAASTLFQQGNGQHAWFVAPSGSAGSSISWTPAMTLNASGNLLVGTTSASTPATTGSVSCANTFGFKNRIINGDMRIDQRNAGASVTPTNPSYTLDRWRFAVSQASKLTAQQSSVAPTGFVNSLLITSSSAYSVLASDYFEVQHRIEGLNTADLAWGSVNAATVTLSFWVRSSLTGTFGGAINNTNYSRSYPFSYVINSANTWEQKSITIPGDTSGTWLTTNGIGIAVTFSLGMGSTYSGTAGSWAGSDYESATGATSVVGTNGATFYITGVQLEKGTAATSFDYRPYGTELALCQRYYITIPNTSINLCGYSGLASTTMRITASFPVTMRSAPTLVSSLTYSYVGSCSNGTVVASDANTYTYGCLAGGQFILTASSGSATFSAEL